MVDISVIAVIIGYQVLRRDRKFAVGRTDMVDIILIPLSWCT